MGFLWEAPENFRTSLRRSNSLGSSGTWRLSDVSMGPIISPFVGKLMINHGISEDFGVPYLQINP
jgi:hypothetical protein